MRAKSLNSQDSNESHHKPEGEKRKGPARLRAGSSNGMRLAKLAKILQAPKGNLIAVRDGFLLFMWVFFFW